MKKSTMQWLSGILMIVTAYVVDTVLSGKFYDFSDPNTLGAVQIALIVILGAMLIGGVVLIVMGVKQAKKEKKEAGQNTNAE